LQGRGTGHRFFGGLGAALGFDQTGHHHRGLGGR